MAQLVERRHAARAEEEPRRTQLVEAALHRVAVEDGAGEVGIAQPQGAQRGGQQRLVPGQGWGWG